MCGCNKEINMQKIFLSACVAFILSAAAVPGRSQILFDQPYDPAGGLYHSCRWDPDGSDWDQYVWDNFTLPNNSDITEIRWRGAFDPAYNGSGGPEQNFRRDFDGSAAANTEPDVSHPPLKRYYAGGNANQTPAGMVGGVNTYDYVLSLPTAFHAVKGTKYWIQIEAYQWGVPDWSLLKGMGGNGVHFRGIGGTGLYYSFISGDTAFTLSGTFISSAASDFDGDGRSDLAVFRSSDGHWYMRASSDGTDDTMSWGLAGDMPAPGDYDADGRTDIAVYRWSSGYWFLYKSSGGIVQVPFGLASIDLPTAADFDGDGKTDIAVFRPSTGVWYLQQSTSGFMAMQFGQAGDKPVPGDYDGDSKADIAVYRPSTGVWYLFQSSAGFAAIQFGTVSDKVVPADYDGDGKTDIAVYRDGDQGYWYFRHPSGYTYNAWGTTGDIPTPADYDGDGKAEVSVFRPSSGIWYRTDNTLPFFAEYFGMNGDKPIPSSYVPEQ
jgi:hypothetical protein